MPTKENTRAVVAKVRADLAKAGKSDELKASLAADVVVFVASRCQQIVDEAPSLDDARATIGEEFGL